MQEGPHFLRWYLQAAQAGCAVFFEELVPRSMLLHAKFRAKEEEEPLISHPTAI